MKTYTFQENYEKIFGSIEEGWFDNMGNAAKKAYIQKFPNSKFAKNTKKKADDKKGKESSHQKELDTLSKDIKNLKGAVDHTQDKGDWAANRNWRDKLEKSQKQWMKLKGKGPDESINISDKLEEGWWDNMGDAAKKSYIKKHGSAPNVAGDDDYDMGEVPGSRELDDTPEDDSEKGSSLTSAPGRVPDEEPSGEEKPSGWSQKAQKAKDDLEQLSDPDEIGDWIEDNKWSLSGGKLGRAADLEFAPVQKAYAELEDAYMEGDWDVYDKAKEDFTKLTNQKLDSQKVSRSRRTGKELDQETLTIDGNQYRRINEGVEQKPKYTFSEFYQRFKR